MHNIVMPLIMLMIPLVFATCSSPEPVTSDLAAVGRAEAGPGGLQQLSTETLSTRLVALDRAVSRWQCGFYSPGCA